MHRDGHGSSRTVVTIGLLCYSNDAPRFQGARRDTLPAYIDIYCERLGPGLLAEPVNALTNAALLVAAVVVGLQARRRTLWARVLDEVPILLFQLAYLWIYARRAIGMGRAASFCALAAFLAVALYARQFPQLLNGSLVYAPAVAATAVLGVYHARTVRPERWALLAAAAVLLLAVWARTADADVCDRFPLGTHFLWHLAVALVLYLSLRALMAARRMRREPLAPAG
jgi:hypothetical protein